MRSNLKDIHNLYWLHWQGHFQLLRRLWAVLFPPTKYIYIDTLSGQIKQSNIRTFSLSLQVSLFFWLLYFYFKFSLTSLSFRLVSLCSFNELHIGALKFSESFFFFFLLFYIALHCCAVRIILVMDMKYVRILFPVPFQLSTIPPSDKSPLLCPSFFFPFSIYVKLSDHYGKIMTSFYKLLHLFYFPRFGAEI